MDLGPPRRRRARPVADAPERALLAAERELAKGWLLALVEQTPLERAGAILGGELAREGPQLCAAIVRALRDDAELARLGPGGDLETLAARVGELGGDADLHGTLRAVQTLTEVMWSGIRGHLAAPDPDLVGELYARLTLIADSIRAAALREEPTGGPPQGVAHPSGEVQSSGEVHPSDEVRPNGDARVSGEVHPSDELRPHGDAQPNGEAQSNGEAQTVAAPAAAPRPVHAAPPPSAALWKAALKEEIVHSNASGAPLSLLLVAVDDAERLRAAEGAGEAGGSFARFLQAVRSVVRREDVLARETEERIWVIARATARPGAQALAERALEAVREAAQWPGRALTASAGVAVLGEDGADVEGLVGACEEAWYAAAASGLGVIPVTAPERESPTRE